MFHVFMEIMSGFCLINSGCGAIVVDHSLVYSYTKMLYYFPVLSWTIHFSRLISLFCFNYVFCAWIQLVAELEFSHHLPPTCKSCFSILIYNECQLIPEGDNDYAFPCARYELTLMLLSAHMVLFYFYPLSCILNVQTCW